MKLLIAVGAFVILGILILESLYFRRAIFVLIIPTTVVVSTVAAILREDQKLVWPIIGISFFHIFLAAYLTLIFSFYFFFKPFYIIMVLNWAFDTLYTAKTLSYYIQCFCIFAVLTLFFCFNLWQLRVSLRFSLFLESQKVEAIEKQLKNKINDTNSTDFGSSTNSGNNNSSSKILNQPPIIFPVTEKKMTPPVTTKQQQQLLTASNNNLLSINYNQTGTIYSIPNQENSRNFSQEYTSRGDSNIHNIGRRGSLSEIRKYHI